jgi:hypothetical protein
MFSVFLISIFGLRLLAQTHNNIISRHEFHYTNLFNMTSATAKFQLTPAPTLSGLNKLKHFLALSLLITLSFNGSLVVLFSITLMVVPVIGIRLTKI